MLSNMPIRTTPVANQVKFEETTDDTVKLTVEDDGIGWAGEGRPEGDRHPGRASSAMARGLGSEVEYCGGTAGCCISLEFEVRPLN